MFFIVYFIGIVLGLLALKFHLIEDFQKNNLYNDFNKFLKSNMVIIKIELIIILIPYLNLIYAGLKLLSLDKIDRLLLKNLRIFLFPDKKE
jgi:hypothetical protein